MNTARVSRTLGAVHGENAVSASRRLPVAGKIQAGMKVLTKDAASVPGASEAYAAGVDAGASFDDIAAALKKIKGMPNYPLTPRNTPYFTVRQGDFATPGAAQAIMDAYATVAHGDPEPRLYAFPIIFPSDDIDLVFRETFEAYKNGKLHRWSEPSQSGRLNCMRRLEEVAPNAGRRWGGRPVEIDRPCDPNDCPLFAAGKCKHVASLNFWIPGVKGAGTIKLTFTSIYASLGIAETLEMVRAGLGRIQGLHQGEPIFWLSKGREKVARVNWETGKPEQTEQWIIRMEASGLDMVQILSGSAPLVALPAPAPAPAPEPERQIQDAEPEPDPAAPTVAELRKHISALFAELDWDRDMQSDWLSLTFDDPKTATRTVEGLQAVAERLEAMLGKRTEAEPAEPAQAALYADVPF